MKSDVLYYVSEDEKGVVLKTYNSESDSWEITFSGPIYDALMFLLRDIDAELSIPPSLPWVSTDKQLPEAGEIVFMYSASSNEASHGHFVHERGGVRVTHWMRVYSPVEEP